MRSRIVRTDRIHSVKVSATRLWVAAWLVVVLVVPEAVVPVEVAAVAVVLVVVDQAAVVLVDQVVAAVATI